MLSDWYFCCSVVSKPAATNAILGILNTFVEADDCRLHDIAHDELARTELWTQVYALPHVLRSMRAHGGERHGRSGAEMRYFDRLTGFSREDCAEAIDACFRSLGPDGMVKEVGALEDAANIIVIGGRHTAPAEIPYIDIPAFVAESVLAAVLAAQFERDDPPPLVVRALKQRGPLYQFVELALGQRYGRLACCLAARVANHPATAYSVDTLQKHISDAGLLLIEPDLLLEYVRTLYRGHPTVEGIKRLLDQSQCWRDDPAGERKEIPVGVEDSVVERMGVPAVKGNQLDLSGILWRATVLHLATEFAPEIAAQILSDSWRPWQTERLPMQNGRYLMPRKESGRLISVLGAATAAARLLINISDKHPSRRQLLLIVAYSADVLRNATPALKGQTVGQWLDALAYGGNSNVLEAPLGGLALAIRAQIGDLGAGRLLKVGPAEFVNLFDGSAELSVNEKSFVTQYLPRVLVNWIFDGYPGALDVGGPSRWLPYVPIVHARHQEGKDSIPGKVLAAALSRFLAPETPITVEGRLDWRSAKGSEGPLYWAVSARQLMLPVGASIEDWEQPEWDEPAPDWEGVLARATERLAAVADLAGNGRIAYPNAQSWINDWRTRLAAVDDTKHVDRFLRLRLLELLDSVVFADSAEDQLLIVRLTLEYGSAYDLVQLFGRLFWHVRPDPGDVPQARRVVRIGAARVAARWLDRYESGLHVRRHAQHAAQHPRDAVIQAAQAAAVRAFAQRLTFKGRTDEGCRAAADAFEEEWADRRGRGATMPWRRCAVPLDADASRLLGATSPDAWLRQAIVIDANDQVATVFANRFNHVPAFNGLSASDDEWANFKVQGANRATVLGIVVAATDSGRCEKEYIFNWGAPTYLTWHRTAAPQLRAGKVVALAVERRPDGTWAVPRGAKYNLVPTSYAPGEIAWVSVADVSGCATLVEPPAGPNHADDSVWHADLSRVFWKTREARRENVICVLDERRGWLPFDGDFRDLLRTGIPLGERVGVLTISDVIETTEFRGWRFIGTPGRTYLVNRHEFTDVAVAQLDEATKTEESIRGLLIAVEVDPVSTGETPRLQLARHIPEGRYGERYPDFRAPVDTRNIDWRKLFDIGAKEIAFGDSGRWWITLGDRRPPGFPDRLEVQIIPSPRPCAELVFTVNEWDPVGPILRGQAATAERVNPIAGDWRSFLARWTGPRNGDRVCLKRVIWKAQQPGGYVKCVTDENVKVWVEAESLTMLPLTDAMEQLRDVRVAEVESYRSDRNDKRGRRPLEVDISTIPTSVLQHETCIGIITKLYDDRDRCEVVWHCEEPAPVVTVIRNLADREFWMISPGSVIDGALDGRAWRFHARVNIPRVRALWKVVPVPTAPVLTHLGTVNYDGAHQRLAEASPGLLVLNPVGIESAHAHLTRISRTERRVLIDPSDRLTARASDGRVRLEGRAGMIAGTCRKWCPAGDIKLAQVRLSLENKTGGFVSLRREFDLRRVESTAPQSATVPPIGLSQKELWDQFLNEEQQASLVTSDRAEVPSRMAPQDCTVTVTRSKDGGWDARLTSHALGLMVPRMDDTWTSTVHVSQEEGPLVQHAQYGQEGDARLFEEADGTWQASLRRVRPWSTSDIQELFSAGLGQRYELEETSLYYFGVALTADGDFPNETYHLFELGYGHIARIPERKLRFNGNAFAQAELLLWAGDRVTAVTFSEDPLETEHQDDDDETSQPVVEINSIDIEFSDAHEIYDQCRINHMVHLLGVTLVEDKIRIERVEGFDRRGLTYEPHPFTVSARLQSSRELEQRLKAQDRNARSCVIYGRLHRETFEKSRGHDVAFEHVKLTLDRSENPSGLVNNELLFLKAQEIVPRRNDIALVVGPANGVDPTDVGVDICGDRRTLEIRRRHFSIREELLRRIPRGGLQGRLLLARVYRDERKMPRASLVRSPPHRTVQGLELEVRQGAVLVTVVGHDQHGLAVEFRPGLFVKLGPNELNADEQFEEGAVVRVALIKTDKCERQFRITRAAFGDARYVPQGVRPAVMLPKNELFRVNVPEETAERHYWSRKKFTIADLPSLLPTGAAWSNSKWNPPDASEFVTLMQQKHPRLVCIGFDENGELHVDPRGRLSAGMLQRVGSSLSVQTVLVTGEARPTLWRTLTFADEPVSAIIERATRHHLRYHDDHTTVWGANAQAHDEPLLSRSVWDGPLFFQHGDKDSLTLRYPVDQWLRYGLPGDVLIDELRQLATHQITLPVVGTSNQSLWVELAPGRIAELPGALIEEPITRTTFENFAWSAMASGDRVTLSLTRMPATTRDSYGIDTVHLVMWESSCRAAFGSGRAVLPIIERDAERGSLKAGVGVWHMTLPFEEECLPESLLMIRSDNHTAFLPPNQRDGKRLQQGDVLLLTLDLQGRLCIAGWPELRPWPDTTSNSLWVDNAAWRSLVVDGKFRVTSSMLESVGGALPVTVERVLQDGRTVFVSPRTVSGERLIPSGSFLCAEVLGLMHDGCTCVLRCGGLLFVHAAVVVSGVPPSRLPDVINALRRMRRMVWLRRDADDIIRGGLKPESSTELPIRSVVSVSVGDGMPVGLVVASERTLALYWMPRDRIAWMDIPSLEFERLVVHHSLPPARLLEESMGERIASIVDTRDARQLFTSLSTGGELTVRVVKLIDDSPLSRRYIAESCLTKIFLQLESRGGEAWPEGQLIPVEVLRCVREQQPRLTVVPVGQRPVRLDLPLWMLRSNAHGLSNAMREWIKARVNAGIEVNRAVQSLTESELLHGLWGIRQGKPAFVNNYDRQLEIADEWLRRHRSDQELFVPSALMVVLILENIARAPVATELGAGSAAQRNRCRIDALELARDLGERAIRSGHIEVLACYLLNEIGATGAHRLESRLLALLASLSAPNEGTVKRIRQFCEATHLHTDASRNLVAVAEALSAATGQLSELSELVQSAPLTLKRLADVFRTLPRKTVSDDRDSDGLHETHRKALEDVLENLLRQGIDLTLPRAIR